MLHEFEEYYWPGGFPWICNEVLMPKAGGPPDRYVLNRNNAAFVNLLAWLFYLVPVFFPNLYLAWPRSGSIRSDRPGDCAWGHYEPEAEDLV